MLNKIKISLPENLWNIEKGRRYNRIIAAYFLIGDYLFQQHSSRKRSVLVSGHGHTCKPSEKVI